VREEALRCNLDLVVIHLVGGTLLLIIRKRIGWRLSILMKEYNFLQIYTCYLLAGCRSA